MGAIAKGYGANEAAVLAVEAGADILLMPVDPVGAIQAVCSAVEAGRITPERIRESVERIWTAKQKACALPLQETTSHAWESIQPIVQAKDLMVQLAQPSAIALVDAILQDSQRIHSPCLSRLANLVAQDNRNLVILDDVLERDLIGNHTPAVTIPTSKGYRLELIDAHTSKDALNRSSIHQQPTLLQLFIRGNPLRGSAGLNQTAQEWLQFLIDSGQLQALVIYGSPYILDQFVLTLPPNVPYVFSYGQMPQAQAIALNALFSIA